LAMRCFKHPDREAVGMCKVCNKGLCSECAVEIDGFLFCNTHAKMERAVKRAEMEAFGGIEEAGFERPRVEAPAPREIKPALRPLKPAMPKKVLRVKAQSMLAPALVGGIVSGTPSGIPFLNFICILWMVLGGAASAYLLLVKESAKTSERSKLSIADSIFVGALSGIFGGSIAFVFSMFFGINLWQSMLDMLLSSGVEYSLADLLLRIIVVDPQLDVFQLLAKWLLFTIIFPIFGAVGGVLAAKLTE